MLKSRKVVSVKTLETQGAKYVKAMIRKSYGNMTRPVVILFFNNAPTNAHCNCPIGSCGLCCHVIALLLFLKHYKDTKEKILQLICTEQLQKWHKRTSKGSIPTMALAKLKLRSATRKKKISPADPDNPYNKRNVTKMIEQINKKLKNFIPVTEHAYSVLSKSEIGRKSSCGQHLLFKFKVNALADHQYLGQYTEEIFSKKQNIEAKSELIEKRILQLYGNETISCPVQNKIKIEDIILQNCLNIDIVDFKSEYRKDANYKDIEN